jgi:ATP-dependent 26S proteasome regulatory subunit
MSVHEKKLNDLIEADVKVIQIVSYETMRVHAMLAKAAKALDRDLYIWNRVEGLKKWKPKDNKPVVENADMRNGEAIFRFFEPCDNAILLLEDFYPDLTDRNPENIRRVRNFALKNQPNKTLILSQPQMSLPFELEREVHVFELPLPDAVAIKSIYKTVCAKRGVGGAGEPDRELINAALGLTIMEAEKAFSLAYVESGKLTAAEVSLVIKEKENVIKKSGFLEYYHPKENMGDVGGLENLKDWLKKRGKGFNDDAVKYGLTNPKGILLLGVPGTGKSLVAKAIGNLWSFPLLRLDMGKIFGGIVGQSEGNIRGALSIAEAIAPSILWIDEIEKATSGMRSSGSTDGGTTSRVLGTFLTWMQERTKPVFVVATANNMSELPPELLRKGRVDEIFFVDLPAQNERQEIISIHLRRKNREPSRFNIAKLAQDCAGFSGAELEEVVKEALFCAFDDGGREITDADIGDAIRKTYPLSQTMREVIDNMRKWAKSRAVAASKEEPEELPSEKNMDVPKLKQEGYSNPFM